MARREGRLRPEFEAWYPSLRSGKWYSADLLTATVLEQLRSGAPQWQSEDRVPDDAHFEFRGGEDVQREQRRTRRLDPRSPA